MPRFNEMPEDDQVRVMKGTFAPTAAPFKNDAPWDGVDKRTGRPIQGHTVDPAFDVAASRMAEPRKIPALTADAAPPKSIPTRPERRPLEIEPGFLVDDIRSVAQCDEARAILIDAVNSIEGQLEAAYVREKTGEAKIDLEWERRAKGALRAKRAALGEVRFLRDRLLRQEQADGRVERHRAILGVVHEIAPDIFEKARTLAEERGLIAVD